MKLFNIIPELEYQLVALYSLLVIASSLPSLRVLAGLFVVPYYMFVPGYEVTKLIFSEIRTDGRFFSSIIISIALVSSLYSLQVITAGRVIVQPSIFIPLITLLLLSLNYWIKVR
jgi:hypothetical protein